MSSGFKLDKQSAASLLSDPGTKATTLHAILSAAYPGDFVYPPHPNNPGFNVMQEPAVIWQALEEDFQVRVPDECENKLNALMTAISTDAFYNNTQQFGAICSALHSGDLGDFVNGVFDDLTLPEILWATWEVEFHRDDDMELSPAIQALIQRESAEEAEDQESMGVDELVVHYADRFMVEEMQELVRQLQRLGVPVEMISQILNSDRTPAHSDEGEFTGLEAEVESDEVLQYVQAP